MAVLQQGCWSPGHFPGEVLLPFLMALLFIEIPSTLAVKTLFFWFLCLRELSSHSRTASLGLCPDCPMTVGDA